MMDISVDGKHVWNSSKFEVVEDSTPLDPTDSTGGTAQVSFTAPYKSAGKIILGKKVTVNDGADDVMTGVISGLTANETSLTATADSRLNALNVERVAEPFSGTLGDLFAYYLGLVGITETITIDDSIASRTVTVKGWYANVWTQVKKLCVAQQVEIALVSNQIVVRKPRGRTTVNYRDSHRSTTVDTSGRAKSFDIYVYSAQSLDTGTVYPRAGTKPSVFTVDSGETVTETIDLSPAGDGEGVTVTAVNQPVAHNALDEYDDDGGYTITGSDGKSYWAGTWVKRGGKVEVRIGPQRDSLIVTITGALDGARGPFSIALAGNDHLSTPSLKITGKGLFYHRQLRTFETGISADLASRDTGATIDNEFVTPDNLYDVAQHAMARYIGPAQTLSATSKDIGQQVGDIAGTRVVDEGVLYRIRTAKKRREDVEYQADLDVTFGDWNERVSDTYTAADWNADYPDATALSFNLSPLPGGG